MKHILLPCFDDPLCLGDLLRENLSDHKRGWLEFRAAVAFVKRSGVIHIQPELTSFSDRGSVRISVGVDVKGTSQEGLAVLLQCVSGGGNEVWVFHNEHPSRPTFHPKIYFFRKPDSALAIIGSGNLTAGGLFSNYEANLVIQLDLSVRDDADIAAAIDGLLNRWCDPASGLALQLSEDLLRRLVDAGLVPPEAAARGDSEPPNQSQSEAELGKLPALFARVPVRRAPTSGTSRRAMRTPASGRPRHRGFLMTLQRTDVGVGQTTAGTSRRSPEIFIPLIARDGDPEFWGWPRAFSEDKSRPGKMDRHAVRMRIGGQTIDVNMMTWPVKRDFRLRAEALRSAGTIGDILRIERSYAGTDFEYYVEIIPQGTSDHARRLAQCNQPVRNSEKRFGYY